jgi:hypothetical protein
MVAADADAGHALRASIAAETAMVEIRRSM